MPLIKKTLWWRRLLEMGLIYLCIEGIISLLFYEFKLTLLIKDVILGLAYMAFVGWVILRRPYLDWPRVLTLPLAAFVVLGIVQFFNPALESLLVGLVGVRTRLFYIPLLLLGYFYLNKKHDLETLGLLLALPSIPVNLLAILQYLLGPERVAQWGTGFAVSIWSVGNFEGVPVYRPVATFSHTGHYAAYLLAITLVTAAFCNFSRTPARLWLFRITLALQFAGIMVNGARTTLLFVPLGVLLIWLLSILWRSWSGLGRIQWRVLTVNLGMILIGTFGGFIIAPTGLYRAQSILAPSQPGQLVTVDGERYDVKEQLNIFDVLRVSVQRLGRVDRQNLWRGYGLGSASPGTRYITATPDRFMGNGLFEGLMGQFIWEFGLSGLILFYLAWLSLLGWGAYNAFGLRDPLLQSITVAIVLYHAFLFVTTGTYTLVAYAPTSVYFWLFLGLLMALPRLERPEAEPAFYA